MKIVVRIPNWIGDVLFALPALESLKAAHPEAEIWLAAGAWVKGLFAGSEYADRIVPLPPLHRWKDLRAAAKALEARRFEIGLLLTNSFSSALLFAAARIPERWGYRRDGRGVFLTKSVARKSEDPPSHMVYYYLRLLEGLGLPTVPPEIKLSLPPEGQELARKTLAGLGADPKRPVVILNPGAAFGPAKRWPASRFAELGRLLQERKEVVLAVTGGPEDSEAAEEIAAFLPEKPLNLVGKTRLGELLGITSLAAVFITNDTGPMHMANALRVPVVGLFGPTDPRATAPFHAPATVIKKEDIPCWPCSNRECPFDHRCLLRICAAVVFEAAAAYLP
jgi:heptosyltransferase-2